MAKKRNRLEIYGLGKEKALDLLRQMWEIRLFEERVYDLLGQNVIKGASHLYAGEEAVAVGAISTLRDDDLITSTHRGHGHCHARGASLVKTEEARQQHYDKMMAELCGRETGYCLGRGGSMHIADVEKGNLGATGIVGGNIPVATGAALAQTMQGSDRVVLCFFGDGASSTGNFHESLNMAGLWALPVVYIVENNLYGMSVPIAKAAAKLDIADRACAYNMPGEVVDGMDVLAVRTAVGRAVERARQGKGPSLIECQTYRWYGHSRSDPRAYRTKQEEADWKARDPIPRFAAWLLDNDVCSREEVDAVEARARQAIEVATDFALKSPFPAPEEVDRFVFAPFHWTPADYERERALRARCRAGGPGTEKIRFWEAIRDALREEMRPRSVRLCPGRGCRAVRWGVWCHAWSVRGVWRGAGARYAHLRSDHRRSGGRRGHGRHAAGGRDHVRRLYAAGHGPDRQPGRQEPLHVRRQDDRAHGHPHRGRRGPEHRRAPLAEPRGAVDPLPRHLRGHAQHPV